MIISLLIGYITALLPIWDWNTRLELFAGTIVLSITVSGDPDLAAGEEKSN